MLDAFEVNLGETKEERCKRQILAVTEQHHERGKVALSPLLKGIYL